MNDALEEGTKRLTYMDFSDEQKKAIGNSTDNIWYRQRPVQVRQP